METNRVIYLLDLLIRYLGLIMGIAIILGSVERLHLTATRKNLLAGAAFGLAACLLMVSPVVLADGTVVNGRSIFLGFSAAFGGLPAFVVAAAITSVALRLLVNVDLVQALIASGITGIWGFAWRRFIFPRYGFRVSSLTFLGTGLSGLTLVLLFSHSGNGLTLFAHTFPTAAVGSLLGALILGRLIEREYRHLGNERRWREEAYTDSLTSVANKRAFFEAVKRLEQCVHPYAIAVIDIDHFKRVNDMCGHAMGDEVLQKVAAKISQTLPRNAEAFRLGGEEFVVIFIEDAAKMVVSICKEIRFTIERDIRAEGQAVTVSIGVADSVFTASSESVIGAADAALYTAKRNGRNRIVSSMTGLAELSSSEKAPLVG